MADYVDDAIMNKNKNYKAFHFCVKLSTKFKKLPAKKKTHIIGKFCGKVSIKMVEVNA